MLRMQGELNTKSLMFMPRWHITFWKLSVFQYHVLAASQCTAFPKFSENDLVNQCENLQNLHSFGSVAEILAL